MKSNQSMPVRRLSRVSDLKTPLKLIVPIWLVFLVFALSIFFIFIPTFKTNQIAQKKNMIQTLTHSAVSLLTEYNRRVEIGELTLEEAQTRALNQIRQLRYGSEGKDYFWILDNHPFMLMHPFRPDLEGRDLTMFKDPQGGYPFIAMVQEVLQHTGGYVNYYWQWKNEPHRIVPKISYVKGFSPWKWIVGTGIYTEDVLMEIKGVMQHLIRIFTGILLFILVLSVYISWQTLRIRAKQARIEAAFRKEKQTLSMILESMPHGIALVDNQERYRYVNPYFSLITGYTLDDIPDKRTWFEKAYPDPDYRQKVMKAWETDGQRNAAELYEFKIRCKNGKYKHIEFRTSYLHAQKISVLTDITARRETEKMRRERDRLQGALEISGTICHEMNQPLMSVEGYFDLMVMDLPDHGPLREKTKKIKKQLNRMADITQKLMEISGGPSGDNINNRVARPSAPAKLERFNAK